MRPDKWLLARWEGMAPRRRYSLVIVGVVLLVGASAAGYKQYTFVMHDNKFCLSCHLMTDPYERFQRSAHNQLSCHSCHPVSAGALWQVYAAVFIQPTRVTKHAHVPNEVCGTCHIDGDPDHWRVIANTAGHRLHLESSSPALRAIMCVDCHGESLHELAPDQQTCLQGGCHAYAHIRLGRMADRDIYCTTCHAFTVDAPTIAIDSLGRPLSPKARQCFSCHEMRERLGNMEFTHDPHRGECGDCHNPHEQRHGSEAGITCASSNCHTDWRRSPFHNGVPNPSECTRCHIPHSWKVEGSNCLRCHANIVQPTRPGRAHREVTAAPGAHRDLAAR